MSTSGLTNEYNPPTLDGLTVIDADEVYIDGQKVDLSKYVPYVGADQVLDMGALAVRSSNVPSTGNDLINYTTLVGAISNQDVTNSVTFLNKITTTAQTVAGQVTFNNSVIMDKTANLASVVDVGANYRRNESDAGVTANYRFGSITSAGGIYTATTTGDNATLGLASLTANKRYKINIYVRALPTASYTTSIQLYSSVDGINPAISLDYSAGFNPSSTGFILITGDFVIPASYTTLILLCSNTNNPSYVTPVEWYGLELYDMGVSLTNVTMPSMTADRVAVLNDKKQLVSSGINTTKLGYLDNVSSDIQTQLNARALTTYVDTQDALRVPYTGATAGLDMGAFSIKTTYAPVAGADVVNRTYADTTYATSSALAGYLPLSGGNLTGDVTQNATKMVSFSGGALKTQWVALGYTASSFSAIAIPSQSILLGTITNPSAWRLTPASGQATSAMNLTGFTYSAGETYRYVFTNIKSSLPSGEITVFQYDSGGILVTPVYYSVTTSPTTVTGYFTIPPSGGSTAFVFVGAFANQWVEWTGFTLSRMDTAITGSATVSGNVGIGTTAPTRKMDMYLPTGGDEYRVTSPNVQVGMGINGANTFGFLYTRTASDLVFGTNNAERVRILSTGETYFGSKVRIHDSQAGIPANGELGGVGTRLVLWPGDASYTPYALGINASTLWYGVPAGSIHAWYTGTTERMRLTGAGRLGIGTNSPDLGLLQIHNSVGENFLSLSNANYTGTEYINLRFYHGNSTTNRNCYIQSYLPGGNVSWLQFYTSDSGGGIANQMTIKESRVLISNKLNIGGDGDPTGTLQIKNPNSTYTHFGYSNNWNYIRGDTTIFDTSIRLGVSLLPTESVWNSTVRRLPLRNSSSGEIQVGDCSTWRHRNNDVGWTPGYYISNAFYKASGTSTVTIDLYASWWANSGSPFRKNINLSIYSAGVYLAGTFISKGFNTLNNHETISLSYTFTNGEAYPLGWYDIYVFGNGAGVQSDSADYIGWTVTVMG